jgi:multiple sugar transport system permease protein
MHAHSGWRRKGVSLLVGSLLALGGIIMVLPFVWMLLSSFKPAGEIISIPPTWLPSHWTAQSYANLVSERPIFRWYANSLLIGIVMTLVGLLTSSLGGFVFGKYRFKGRELIFLLILGTMMIPFEVIMVPLYKLFVDLNLTDTYPGLMLLGCVSAFGIFVVRQFMQTIPNDLIDAAVIDGASDLQVYWRIVVPLAKPALAAFAIFHFMWSWDWFLWPLIIINNPDMFTLPLGLASFLTSRGVTYDQFMAAASLAVIPTVMVFLIGQKQIIRGIALTGMKG